MPFGGRTAPGTHGQKEDMLNDMADFGAVLFSGM
jgi:hypothetical protein